MNRVTLYVASSLDGYIAREDQSVDWLPPPPEDEDFGYSAFYASVDTIVMGRSTYEQCLAFGDWPYPGKPAYVLSRSQTGKREHDVTFADKPPGISGHTWLVGGAQAIHAYAKAGRIDEWIITLIPVLLGEGVPLFLPAEVQRNLALQNCRTSLGGLVTLHYRKAG